MRFFLLPLLTLITLGACTSDMMTDDVADRIAGPAWMIEREIPAASYNLNAYERMHERAEPANVYIEGDSLAWFTKLNLDADPKNPVALNLAAHDKAPNVAYLARPCQYTQRLNEKGKPSTRSRNHIYENESSCSHAEWQEDRFSPDVLTAYNAALDNIKAHYDITEFNLIGFSGGAAIAAILAAERSDVASLRTVAGIMDHAAFTAHHNSAPLTGSLNPIDYADKLKTIPQNHFVGGNDPIVPFSVLSSYLLAIDSSDCVQYNLVQEAEHQEGWVDKWPVLEKIALPCGTVQPQPSLNLESDIVGYDPIPEGNLIMQKPVYRVPRHLGDKP